MSGDAPSPNLDGSSFYDWNKHAFGESNDITKLSEHLTTSYGKDSDGFNATLAKLDPKSNTGDIAPPTQADAGDAANRDLINRENRQRSASSILTSGSGLLDEPNVYSASRSLLGS